MTTSSPPQRRDDRALRIATAVLAAVGMLVAAFFYVASGLVAPLWALILLWIIWIALAWYGVMLAGRGSYWVLAVPIVAGAVWYAVITFGEQVLGWQA